MQLALRLRPQRPVAQRLCVHVMRDQPGRPLGDQPVERTQARLDVSAAVDPLADVVQQRRQQELLVVGPFFARQLEDLQRVIQNVPFRVVSR